MAEETPLFAFQLIGDKLETIASLYGGDDEDMNATYSDEELNPGDNDISILFGGDEFQEKDDIEDISDLFPSSTSDFSEMDAEVPDTYRNLSEMFGGDNPPSIDVTESDSGYIF